MLKCKKGECMDENQLNKKTRWYKDSIIYQIYPRSYCDSNNDGIGDIRGIISKLDYIEKLGVDTIWLSPVYKSPNFDNGYDISDYRNINPEYGTMEDFEQLVEECKKKNIKIIMDLVVNHTSDKHNWFEESRKKEKNDFSDYYIWRKGRGKDGLTPPNNWSSRFTGPAWTYNEDRKEWFLHLFTSKQPDLNWDNPKVRKEIVDICEYWFEKGVSGFRCDVLTYIAKDQTYKNGKFNIALTGDELFTMYGSWHDYIKELHDKSWSKHDSFVFAEGLGANLEKIRQATKESHGETDSFISFEHLNADTLMSIIPRRLNLRKFKHTFNKYQQNPQDIWNMLYLENHDQERSTTRYIKDENLIREGAKMLAVAMQFQKGTPIIYQGQEIGMTNCQLKVEEYSDIVSLSLHNMFKKSFPVLLPFIEKCLTRKGRENARTPMQWSNEKFAGFSDSKPWIKVNPNKDEINAKQQESDENSVLNFYRDLLKFRKSNEVLKDGSFKDLAAKHKKMFIYERKLKDKAYLVVCNFSNKKSGYNLKNYTFKNSKLMFKNYQNAPEKLDKNIECKPYETRVYELDM